MEGEVPNLIRVPEYPYLVERGRRENVALDPEDRWCPTGDRSPFAIIIIVL